MGGLQELVSRPNIPDVTRLNIATILKIHPVVFRGISVALLRFSRVFLGSQFGFWRHQSVLPGGFCSSELGQKLMDLGRFLVKNRPINWQSGQTVQHDSKKPEPTPESSRKGPVSILRSLLVFLTVPSRKTRIFGLRTR